MSERFAYRTRMPVPAAALAAWHQRPLAFERLAPPWERMEREGPAEPLRDGLEASIRVGMGPLRRRFVATHSLLSERGFVDEQKEGPFQRWRHHHRFLPVDDETSLLEDDIEYSLPLAPFSGPARPWVRHKLARMFRYRHDVTAGDVRVHAEAEPRTVAITGSTGLIGRALVAYLVAGGHRVIRLARPSTVVDEDGPWEVVPWRPDTPEVDSRLEGIDAVVHLAGENVGRRWNAAIRQRIVASRTTAAENLARGLADLKQPPPVLVSASGIGFYGDGGDAVLVEKTSSGHNFLAEVCRDWEDATKPAAEAGLRVVQPRIGLVLDARGGALGRMVSYFQAGLGGTLGTGQQWMSWISLDDTLDVLWRCVVDDSLQGPVNAVTDDPVTNEQLTHLLASVFGRPAVFAIPAPVLRGLFGEMADETLLLSQRVRPQALLDAGHSFRHPRLEIALRHVLGR